MLVKINIAGAALRSYCLYVGKRRKDWVLEPSVFYLLFFIFYVQYYLLIELKDDLH